MQKLPRPVVATLPILVLELLVGILAGGSAGAHVVLDQSTLRQYVQHSHASVHAEFLSGLSMWVAPEGSDRQDYFRVRVIEHLSGAAVPTEFDFFPHSEGVPRFQLGDRALLFIEATETRAEFAALADRFRYFTVQGPGEEWILERDEEPAVVAAARAFASPKPSLGAKALRSALLAQLDTGVPRLQDDALAELVRARNATGFFPSAATAAPFTDWIDSDELSLSRRLALLRLLEDTPGFESAPRWQSILSTAIAADDVARVIQLAGGVDEPAVGVWLAEQLGAPEPDRRRAAARALRQPWHAPHVGALGRALDDPDPRVVRAATQSLGAIADAAARTQLRNRVSLTSGDPRRWAEAELRRLGEIPTTSPSADVGPDAPEPRRD